jgi:hypothetical protein
LFPPDLEAIPFDVDDVGEEQVNQGALGRLEFQSSDGVEPTGNWARGRSSREDTVGVD